MKHSPQCPFLKLPKTTGEMTVEQLLNLEIKRWSLKTVDSRGYFLATLEIIWKIRLSLHCVSRRETSIYTTQHLTERILLFIHMEKCPIKHLEKYLHISYICSCQITCKPSNDRYCLLNLCNYVLLCFCSERSWMRGLRNTRSKLMLSEMPWRIWWITDITPLCAGHYTLVPRERLAPRVSHVWFHPPSWTNLSPTTRQRLRLMHHTNTPSSLLLHCHNYLMMWRLITPGCVLCVTDRTHDYLGFMDFVGTAMCCIAS